MTRLDGKNIHEWKAAYSELVTKFVEYANHQSGCRPDYEHQHKHNFRIDNRMVCDAQPCTCGLTFFMEAIFPTIKYTVPCDLRDEKVVPFKILGIPVHVDDSLPPDTIEVRSDASTVRVLMPQANDGACMFPTSQRCAEWRNMTFGDRWEACRLKHLEG